MELSLENGKWNKKLYTYSSLGSNETLKEENFNPHITKNADYIPLSVNLNAMGFPPRYRLMFYSEEAYENHTPSKMVPREQVIINCRFTFTNYMYFQNKASSYETLYYRFSTSFDHYFANYPHAMNGANISKFTANPHTPSVNGLGTSPALLTYNPNSANPYRLDPSQQRTCDITHSYTGEQKEYDGGLMDKFVQFSDPLFSFNPKEIGKCNPNQVMGYYDGNAVTALWNYAQHYAMSDNYYGSTFGPSVSGHLNLISGQTHGAILSSSSSSSSSNIKGVVNSTVIGNPDPVRDDCSPSFLPPSGMISMIGKNIGNLLNSKDITWGWFSAGFKPSIKSATGKWICAFTNHTSVGGWNSHDYYPDTEPFQYYNSTANPHHLPPTSVSTIGRTDRANHQYDISSFWNAAMSGNLPAVSFLKAATYQDAHPIDSDPVDEQNFLVNTINKLQRLPEWSSTAIIITYDDSGGWYDHVMPPIISQSNDPANDALLGSAGLCGGHVATASSNGTYQDRCGYGPRLPLLIISSYSKVNFIDHSITDQSSILRFIEDNWRLGKIGNQSFDAKASPIMNMFDFSSTKHPANTNLFLNPASGLQIQNSTTSISEVR
jgi:phospholipase C